MADKPKPTPGNKGPVESVVSSLIDFFKHMVDFDLNTILSVADPEIDTAATTLAESAKKKFAKEHWLHTSFANRILAVFSSRIESATKDQPEAVRASAEKVSDFVDAFRRKFYDPAVLAETSADSYIPDANKIAADFDELRKQIVKNYGTEMNAAKSSADRNTVQKEYKERITLLRKMELHMIGTPKKKKLAQPPEPAPTVETPGEKPASKKVTEFLRPINDAVEAQVNRWKANNAPPDTKPWKPGLVIRVLNWPWIFLWWLVFTDKGKWLAALWKEEEQPKTNLTGDFQI